MASRIFSRTLIVACATWRVLTLSRASKFPENPHRILIAHNLLLGDTLVLTPLLAKLREQFSGAEITLLLPPAFAPLYQRHPYGVRIAIFEPRNLATIWTLLSAKKCFDVAIVPGDNRFSWLAKAMGARWLVAFATDRATTKNWLINEQIAIPSVPATWGELVAQLVPGPAPQLYKANLWPDPPYNSFSSPIKPYCVLHVGASTPLKLWQSEKWMALAERLTQYGYQIVWSGGAREQNIVAAIDPQAKFHSYAGQLDLAQMWHLLKGSVLLVCPDTGIAHLGRLVGVPTVALFGPGTPVLFGAGDFWRNSPYCAITIENIPCRDQKMLFNRPVSWVKRCNRSSAECQKAICMERIDILRVWRAIEKLLNLSKDSPSLYRS